MTSSDKTVTVTLNEAAELSCTFIKKNYEKGDVNLDGAVNVSDLVMLQKYIIRAADLAGNDREQSWKNSDLNGDEDVDSLDVSALRKKLIGA